ncbi:MAG: Gfo/Idh/MocA family oxidoreductase [Chloroflexi bacterium]|nr:Gfo/Idh/MocA family oxidoreductase [Chloroflexota bacterium]
MAPMKVGVIGCGNISGIYLTNMPHFDALEVVACADMDPRRAEEAAKKYGISTALSVEDLLANDEIEIVVNLTTPPSHFEVAMAAVKAGKSVHGEKPLTINIEDAETLLSAAAAKGVRVGAAPDTFLGAGIQTCRQLIDEGAIGEPVAATAFMTHHGTENWHPDPAFYYKIGGGPMLDMGPYYLTALVNLMGPIRRVSGSTRITFPERTIGSEPLRGTKIVVETPTHVAGVMDFENGAIGTIMTSFDVWAANLPRIEIYGTEGSLSVPDPNTFSGPVRLFRSSTGEWEDVPVTRRFAGNSRGLGVADMATAIRSGTPHRASGELGLHVLETMHAFQRSSESGGHVDIAHKAARPEALPDGLIEGSIPT